MEKIVLKEDGTVFTLDDKNNEIFEKLRPFLELQIEKKKTNMFLKKPQPLKFGAAINNKLLELFREYGLMPEEYTLSITAEELKDTYLHFMQLVNKVSEDIEITPTKPLFCAYMGITTKIFNSLEKADDAELRRWVDAINGDFAHSIFDSSLQGNASEKTALAFAQTKDYGQETVQNDFNAVITARQEIDYSQKQAEMQAREITNNIAALIEDAKKKKIKSKRG